MYKYFSSVFYFILIYICINSLYAENLTEKIKGFRNLNYFEEFTVYSEQNNLIFKQVDDDDILIYDLNNFEYKKTLSFEIEDWDNRSLVNVSKNSKYLLGFNLDVYLFDSMEQIGKLRTMGPTSFVNNSKTIITIGFNSQNYKHFLDIYDIRLKSFEKIDFERIYIDYSFSNDNLYILFKNFDFCVFDTKTNDFIKIKNLSNYYHEDDNPIIKVSPNEKFLCVNAGSNLTVFEMQNWEKVYKSFPVKYMPNFNTKLDEMLIIDLKSNVILKNTNDFTTIDSFKFLNSNILNAIKIDENNYIIDIGDHSTFVYNRKSSNIKPIFNYGVAINSAINESNDLCISTIRDGITYYKIFDNDFNLKGIYKNIGQKQKYEAKIEYGFLEFLNSETVVLPYYAGNKNNKIGFYNFETQLESSIDYNFKYKLTDISIYDNFKKAIVTCLNGKFYKIDLFNKVVLDSLNLSPDKRAGAVEISHVKNNICQIIYSFIDKNGYSISMSEDGVNFNRVAEINLNEMTKIDDFRLLAYDYGRQSAYFSQNFQNIYTVDYDLFRLNKKNKDKNYLDIIWFPDKIYDSKSSSDKKYLSCGFDQYSKVYDLENFVLIDSTPKYNSNNWLYTKPINKLRHLSHCFYPNSNNLLISNNEGSIYTYAFETTSVRDVLISDNTKLYPNPATERFTIELEKDLFVREIEIYNLMGIAVTEQFGKAELLNNRININNPNGMSGVYFVKIVTDKGILNKKVVINR